MFVTRSPLYNIVRSSRGLRREYGEITDIFTPGDYTDYNLEKNKPKVYSVMYGQLRQETKIKRVKMTGELPSIERTKDPLALLERVKICHYTSVLRRPTDCAQVEDTLVRT
jgi:hypothetical protein